MGKLNRLYLKMTEYFAGDPERIQHFIKVHSFARIIGLEEKLPAKVQKILEAAALVHDIGIRPAEEKYGFSNGKLQEQEGPAEAVKMLKELKFDEEFIQRVAYLVGHHHSYGEIEGMDYQILVEADFLVNYYEEDISVEKIQNSVKKIFRTATGIRLAKTIYSPKGQDKFQLSETWAQDAQQDLEDFIEEQGVYIRQ